jgi:hypothetical protein
MLENNSIKKIVWESWNSLSDTHQITMKTPEPLPSELEEALASDNGELLFLEGGQPLVIHTPLGVYPLESSFKPSDRWDCWIGHTNFGITSETENILKYHIEGIEALRILGRYTFFIGIARCFNFQNIRKDIDSKLCSYTEEEIFSTEEVKKTLEMMKQQFKDENFWSILVDASGNIQYIVSEKNDIKYIREVTKLIEKKKKNGGILLRGDRDKEWYY